MTTIAYPALWMDLLGPVMSLTNIAAKGTIGTNWINTFQTADDNQWAGYANNGAALTADGSGIHMEHGYYYGRDICEWSFYEMGGRTVSKYLDRGLVWALDYFSYFGPNAVSVNEYRSFGRSMALLYAVNGDEAVRTALGKKGTSFDRSVSFNQIEQQMYRTSATLVQNTDHIEPVSGRPAWQAGGADPRTKGRELEQFVVNHIIDAPLVNIIGLWNAPTSWAAAALNCLNKILTAQDPTGTWREAYPSWRNGTPGYAASGTDGWGTLPSPWPSDHPYFPVKSFEVGIVNDAMMLYDRVFPGDSRIQTAITASMTYLMNGGSWTGNTGPLWHSSTQGWRYIEFNGGWEGADYYPSNPVSPSLNGLILTAAAWLYNKTGNASWKTIAENAMISYPIDLAGPAGALSGTPDYALKLINQNYSRCFEAWPLLYGASQPPATNPKHIRGIWR